MRIIRYLRHLFNHLLHHLGLPLPLGLHINLPIQKPELLPAHFSSYSGLKGSRILDNGSNSHVCNNTMLSRFTKTRDAGPLDTLTAGTQTIPIECFGSIQITMKAPTTTGHATMTLLNVAFVSDFMTNLVAGR